MHQPGAPVNIGPTFNSPFGVSKTLSDLVSVILSGSISIASVAVLLLFFVGGFKLIQSAGSGDADQAAQGKAAVTNAFIGFVIIMSVFWIVRVIEIITGADFITSP